jgi:DNA-binding LacI/PurR family transcriptional regulator
LPAGVIFGSGLLLSLFLKLDKFGLRVPEDISIAASHCLPDDFTDGEYPPITRLMPNVRRMAECSIELLGRMMDGEPYPPPIRLPYTLVRSDSIGPPAICR